MTNEFRGRIYDGIAATIGATPLVRISRFSAHHGVKAELLAKLEFFNPLASVKDRLGMALIDAAERDGKITPGKTVLIEPTSGNTGIALAALAAAKGYRIILTMPESMSIERRKMLRFLGAEIVLTPRERGMKGAIEKADELAASTPGAFIPRQFDNPANPEIHRETTGPEIWNDTNGKAAILVAGVGTGGTLTGVSQYMKKKNPAFRTVAVEPEDSAVLSGKPPGLHKMQGIGAGFIPSVVDTKLIDEVFTVSNDAAFATAKEIAKLEGIPVGISSGAALWAAVQVGKKPENAGKQIVVIIPSFAERYLSTALFEGLE